MSEKKAEAHALAAALWRRASGEALSPEAIEALTVKRECRLKQKGRHSVVDLFVSLKTSNGQRELAVEVKVDGSPNGAQLASMASEFELGENRRLVLLTLGAAQVCRMEAAGAWDAKNRWWKRWHIEDLLELGDLIEAASPSAAITRDWREELRREQDRGTAAFADPDDLAGCGFRERLQDVYRYDLVARDLAADGVVWGVSVQPFGVVMTLDPQHCLHLKNGKKSEVVVYLEVVDGCVRVKAGTKDPSIDPRKAAAAVLPRIAAAMEAHDFKGVRSSKKSGQWVTLLSFASEPPRWSRDALVSQLKRAYTAWLSGTG